MLPLAWWSGFSAHISKSPSASRMNRTLPKRVSLAYTRLPAIQKRTELLSKIICRGREQHQGQKEQKAIQNLLQNFVAAKNCKVPEPEYVQCGCPLIVCVWLCPFCSKGLCWAAGISCILYQDFAACIQCICTGAVFASFSCSLKLMKFFPLQLRPPA